MRSLPKNPFSIVKASDFSDQQIKDYWVDIPGGEGFKDIVDPVSTMPMIIVGGKGSGKTHLMRYFSYPLQKIRYNNNIVDFITNEKFIGIYTRCSGLNSKRFSGKGFSEEKWSIIYSYYFDIWLSQLMLETTIDCLTNLKIDYNENLICTKIINCFDEVPFKTQINLTFEIILNELNVLQRSIDLIVNNCAFNGNLDVRIKSTPGNLVFGIPKILEENIPLFKNVLFLYLIDELENVETYQQTYINTLIRDCSYPCAIKVGVRTYGIRTLRTMAADEENRPGSEFEYVRLDSQLRKQKKDSYRIFAKNLCLRRLKEAGLIPSTSNSSVEFLDSFFEDPSYIDELSDIKDLTSGRNGKTILKLENQIENQIDSLHQFGVKKRDIEDILNRLSCQNKPLLEKAGVYLFYKDWSKSENLTDSSIKISELYKKHDNNPDKQFKELIAKFKYDLLAQLRKDNSMRQVYAGVETLIELSKGFPRNLLTMMKHIYQFSVFNGEKPFVEGVISINSQVEGVKQASLWYFEDARLTGKDGIKLKAAMERLAEIFRINRYSDKPPECSLRVFSSNISKASSTTQHLIDLATKWSLLLIDEDGRPDRNSKRVDDKYMLNPMLSPHWGLPVGIRGVINFNKDLLNSIFDPQYENTFDGLKKDFENKHNVPFKKIKPKKFTQRNLW